MGPSMQEEEHMWLPRRAGSSGIPWRILSLVKTTTNRHRACFKPQCASPFRKKVKILKYSEKPFKPERWPLYFCYCLHKLPVVLGSLTLGDQPFFVIVTLCIKITDEREWLLTASPVTTKSRGRPRWGRSNYNYPENGPVKPPGRDTRALSPAGVFGGKAPLCFGSSAEEQAACAISA
jgi:hypothetical protein